MHKALLPLSLLLVGWPLMLWADPLPETMAPAAAPASAPASVPAAPRITVTGVTGAAHKAIAGEGELQWQPLKVGDVLDEHTIIRTGLNSAVMLQMDDRGELKINGSSKIGISEFQKDGDKLKTHLNMKYGSVRAHVDSSRSPNDFSVVTPTATLSVRGSRPEMGYSIDGGSQGHSYEGHLTLDTGGAGGSTQTVNPGEGLTEYLILPSDLLLFGFRTALGDVNGGTTFSEQFSAFQFGGNGRTGSTGFIATGGGNSSQGGGSGPPPVPQSPPQTGPGHP